ncbi:MAG: type II secretion system protein [Clostridia bacterium]|nr:type II secretion system protein [Clostridia bacterium]
MRKNKGFTLAELLIVVAIIAVLVAIAIPIFTAQLEKSREATDIANVRSAYANLVANYLLDDKSTQIDVTARQTQTGWQGTSGTIVQMISGSESAMNFDAKVSPNSYNVKIDASGSVTIG